MQPEEHPRSCPEKQVRLALDAVDVREEPGHQSSGDQQRQRNKTLMYQGRNRFPARSTGGTPSVTKAHRSFVLRCVPAIPPPAQEDNRAATQGSSASTQNKVLVIMDYEIFRKQAYWGTGGQKDSMAGSNAFSTREHLLSVSFERWLYPVGRKDTVSLH